MWATEFGQDTFDEVNLIEPGGNYGWPEVEGVGDDDRFINPKVTWSTDEASPSGLAIAGDTLYVAALRGQRLWTIPLSGDELGRPEAALEGQYGRLRNVQVAPDGSLWITTSNHDGRGDPLHRPFRDRLGNHVGVPRHRRDGNRQPRRRSPRDLRGPRHHGRRPRGGDPGGHRR